MLRTWAISNMGIREKITYFQQLKLNSPASFLAFLVLLSCLLFPAHPFNDEVGRWTEEVDHPRNQRVEEILQIYSILNSNMPGLTEASAWAITRTILEESIRHTLDPMLILAVINVESRFQRSAVSSEGARGLMQILPFVAQALAEEVEINNWEGEKSLDDPILNIKLGVFYLHSLQKSFQNLDLALTAYNWGPTQVRNRLEEEEVVTSEYATKVLSTYYHYRNVPASAKDKQ